MDFWKKAKLYNLCASVSFKERDTFRDVLTAVFRQNQFTNIPSDYIKLAIYKFGTYFAVHFVDSTSPSQLQTLLAPCVDLGLHVISYTHQRDEEVFPNTFVQKSAVVFVPTNHVVVNDMRVIEEDSVALNESIRWLKELIDENPVRSKKPIDWLYKGFINSEITSRECLWSSDIA